MDDVLLNETIERYLLNEMSAEELRQFNELRENMPELDQKVVEHRFFLQKMNAYADQAAFSAQIQRTHQTLVAAQEIEIKEPTTKVVNFWQKSRKVILVAASIAGLIAIATSALIYSISPKVATSDLKLLSLENELNRTKQQINKLDHDLKEKEGNNTLVPMAPSKRDGTGFLIDGRGYLITNLHIISTADSIYVENAKGDYYKATVIHSNKQTDLAILKINDKKYNPIKTLPYSIKKASEDIGEEVFSLGFPRSEIVYAKGYLSAKTGYLGDTLAYQIAISANPGNSGAPLFNANGEIIGVVSGKQTTVDGVVFAIKSQSIFNALKDLKKDSSNINVRPNYTSHVRHLNRVQQIKKIQEGVFIVKSY